jgi:2-polyprenyl-6-methoxyphenol hydroxylase-like FAD-dependent oxidoreductase
MNVLIVGAGIAGPTLAYWLSRGGHTPTLVERSPERRTGGYVLDFWGAGFVVAERMGIAPELVRRGYRAREFRQVRRDGTSMLSFNPELFVGSEDQYVTIARSDLAAVIYGALEGKVETIFGETIRSVDDDGARVRVEFENSDAVRDFDLVVGADGLHSRVRRLVFGPDEQFEKYMGFKVAAFDIKGYRPREELTARLYTEVGFQVTAFPIRDDATMFALTFLDDARELPATREGQESLLRDRFAGAGWETPAVLEQMSSAESLYLDCVSQIRMPSWTRGRVALLGDAAACPSLLAGQGSALAMVEAYVLAAELARAPSHGEAFAAYERKLMSFLRSKQKAAERLASAFAPKNAWQLFVRNSVMKLMTVPLVAKLVAGKSFKDAIELPAAAGARLTRA